MPVWAESRSTASPGLGIFGWPRWWLGYDGLAVPTAASEADQVEFRIPSKSDSGYYNFRYQITWLGQTNSGEISGIDEIDALISGLAVIGSWVHGLNESTYAHRLAWDGSDGNDLGFPTIEHHWPFHGELKQRS